MSTACHFAQFDLVPQNLQAVRLTETIITGLRAEPDRRDRAVFDDAQRGLGVRVTASGSKTYLAQYTLNRRKHRMPIGAVSAITLAAARTAAAVIMGRVARGENPAEVRSKGEAEQERTRQARDVLTLGRLVDDWHRLHLSVNRRPRYAEEQGIRRTGQRRPPIFRLVERKAPPRCRIRGEGLAGSRYPPHGGNRHAAHGGSAGSDRGHPEPHGRQPGRHCRGLSAA